MEDYQKLLNRFVRLCERCTREGQAYLTVILAHELFRFLYPVEPYLGFRHQNPVEFMKRKIKALIDLGQAFRREVVPYDLPMTEFSRNSSLTEGLEKRTSNLYSRLWERFDNDVLWKESIQLLKRRIPMEVIQSHVKGKTVLDMGCGSGRYAIALARMGARKVVGLDIHEKAYARAEVLCRRRGLPVKFQEGNFQRLPFRDASFDFVLSNGVLHHSRSIKQGLRELSRVLNHSGKAFLYLYAAGGIFWKTRQAMRGVFRRIPLDYTRRALELMGLPRNRFIFCDTWYVPLETHTSRRDLERMLRSVGFSFKKVVSNNPFDLDRAIRQRIQGAQEMWGDGEHRYLLENPGPKKVYV